MTQRNLEAEQWKARYDQLQAHIAKGEHIRPPAPIQLTEEQSRSFVDGRVSQLESELEQLKAHIKNKDAHYEVHPLVHENIDLQEEIDELKADNAKLILMPMDSAPRVEREYNPILLKFKDDLSAYYGNFKDRLISLEGKFIVGNFDGFDLDKSDLFDTFALAGPFGRGGFPSDWFDGYLSLDNADTQSNANAKGGGEHD